MPLTPFLYQRLIAEFGDVSIAHKDVSAKASYNHGLFKSGDTQPRLRMHVDTAGEYYRVNCPFCHDSRQRLWINHLWGVQDAVTGAKNLWLAICYNEDCLANTDNLHQLYERVYGFKNAGLRGRQPILVNPGIQPEDPERPGEVELPGDLVPLNLISADHPASVYLQSRLFDIDSLANDYGVALVTTTPGKFWPAKGRIFIPLTMYGKLVGWQCRYPDDLDWKSGVRTPKYYSCPGMPKRLLLYNFDQAVKSAYCVLCEGPTDVWRIGSNGVAVFGKQPSTQQLKLLCDNWPAAIVVCMDGDAWDKTQKISTQLKEYNYSGHIIPVRLQPEQDPGSLNTEEMNDIISHAAKNVGVDLMTLRKSANVYDHRVAEQFVGPVNGPRGQLDTGKTDNSTDLSWDSAGRTGLLKSSS